MRGKATLVVLLAVVVLTNCQCGRQGRQLRSAAAAGDMDRVKALLDAGADVNAADMFGQTALHLAALGGHQDLVEFLVGKDANVNAKDDYGATPLDYAKSKGHTDIVNFLRKSGGSSAKELRKPD